MTRGEDVAWILAAWERGLAESPPDRAVTLLAAVAGLSREEAESVDVGSRDSALADVLHHMAGGIAQAGAWCARCGERLDVPLDLAALPRTPWRTPGETLHVEVGGARVPFRLPTSRDLRLLHGDDAALGRASLLSRCVRIGDEGLAEDVAAAVEAAMEQAAPSGSVTVRIRCPACTETTVAALDVSALLWAEVEWRALALLRDVHVLARAYGWTEPDVLALSPARRAAYLELAEG